MGGQIRLVYHRRWCPVALRWVSHTRRATVVRWKAILLRPA